MAQFSSSRPTAYFLGLLAWERGFDAPAISEEAARMLNTYEIPGNIRELRNVLERALIDAGGGLILAEHLHFVARAGNASAASGRATSPVPTGGTQTSEEEQILEFTRKKGSINNAQCRHLLSVGIHRAWYLLRKLHKQGSLQQESSGRWARCRIPEPSDQ